MKPFHFKQFTIHQDKSAMKIGTDGVLLGAWCTIKKELNVILDIGTGTGLIALQMAQRSQAEIIDAVEIDANSFEQAVANFENSPWADRLFCYHASLQDFTSEIDETYDLIISNPPFYTDSFKTESQSRNNARFTSSLSFESLLKSVSEMLSAEGIFALILPYKEASKFIEQAVSHQLYVNRICNIKGNHTSEVKRSMMEFSFQEGQIEQSDLVIEKERHQYTDDYLTIVQDFYRNM